MQHISLGNTEFYFSNEPELNISNHEDIRSHINKIIEAYTKRKAAKAALEAIAKEGNEIRYAILQNHGTKQKPWSYKDNGLVIPVQEWIEAHDGKEQALLLCVCNEGNQKIYSKSSIVIHPESIFTELEMIQGKLRLKVYMPGFDYIESNYKMIKELKR